jgi:uncharacterized protein
LEEKMLSDETIPLPKKPFPLVWKSLLWIIIFYIIQLISAEITLKIDAKIDPENHRLLILAQEKFISTNPRPNNFLDLFDWAQKLSEVSIPYTAVANLFGLIFSGFVTLGLLLFHLRKDNRKQLIGLSLNTSRPQSKDIVLSILLIALTYVFQHFYSLYIIDNKEVQNFTVQFLRAIPSNAFYFAAKVLAVAVFAGLLEEIIFRGFLQNALKRHMSAGAAIVVAAVIFGAIHFQPLAFPGLALMGAVFGYIYHRTGSLYATIALHAANNAMALAFL